MSINMEVPSKEEYKESGQGKDFAPLESGNYICRVSKIDLKKKPKWINGGFNPNVLDWSYSLIILPFSTESGAPMRDTGGEEVKPLTKWIFKDFNPFSLGFTQNDVPSMMRSSLCHLSGQNPRERLKLQGIIVIDNANEMVTDEAIITKFIDESKLEDNAQTLAKQGYKFAPDIRMFEGKYIGCSLEVNEKKGRNNIVTLNKLPENFKEPEENSVVKEMCDFTERYEKMIAKQGTPAVASTEVEDNSEVVVEDIAL